MRYTVLWKPTAEADLASLWADAQIGRKSPRRPIRSTFCFRPIPKPGASLAQGPTASSSCLRWRSLSRSRNSIELSGCWVSVAFHRIRPGRDRSLGHKDHNTLTIGGKEVQL